MREIFEEIVRRLGEKAPDLGEEVSGEATFLSGQGGRREGGPPSDLPQPCGGRKEYREEGGNVTKVVKWFGYTLHLLTDSRHEVALGWRVTSPGADDGNAWGTERFHGQVGAMMVVVHLAFATRLAERAEGRGVLGKTRLDRLAAESPARRTPT